MSYCSVCDKPIAQHECFCLDVPNDQAEQILNAPSADQELSIVKRVAAGLKHDAGKTDWMILFEHLKPELEEVVKTLKHGEKTYGRNSWMQLENWKVRYTNAMFRHVTAYASGEYKDSQTGISHLVHAICCQLFLHYMERTICP